ncbi:MAG: hypothetical protein QW815_01160 [Nitrososphaerota archaeon]
MTDLKRRFPPLKISVALIKPPEEEEWDIEWYKEGEGGKKRPPKEGHKALHNLYQYWGGMRYKPASALLRSIVTYLVPLMEIEWKIRFSDETEENIKNIVEEIVKVIREVAAYEPTATEGQTLTFTNVEDEQEGKTYNMTIRFSPQVEKKGGWDEMKMEIEVVKVIEVGKTAENPAFPLREQILKTLNQIIKRIW